MNSVLLRQYGLQVIMRRMKLCFVFVLCLVLFAAAAVFAQQAPLPAAPAAPSAATTKAPQAEAPINEGHERMLGVVPAFGVTNRQDAPALTTRQKFVLFARTASDPFAFVAAGLEAGISQVQNEFPEFGQGPAGLGKRYGVSLLDATSSNFFTNFAYPALLKQDPRYFRLGQGSIKHRILYSVTQEFSTKSDSADRHRVFNWSNVLGAFSTGGLSNAYYPPGERGFSLTMSRSAISLAYGAVGGLASEFWPDVNRKFFHKKAKDPAPAVQPEDGK